VARVGGDREGERRKEKGEGERGEHTGSGGDSACSGESSRGGSLQVGRGAGGGDGGRGGEDEAEGLELHFCEGPKEGLLCG